MYDQRQTFSSVVIMKSSAYIGFLFSAALCVASVESLHEDLWKDWLLDNNTSDTDYPRHLLFDREFPEFGFPEAGRLRVTYVTRCQLEVLSSQKVELHLYCQLNKNCSACRILQQWLYVSCPLLQFSLCLNCTKFSGNYSEDGLS